MATSAARSQACRDRQKAKRAREVTLAVVRGIVADIVAAAVEPDPRQRYVHNGNLAWD